MSWNDEKQRRFDRLRRAELRAPLAEEDAADLATLIAELEAEEQVTLAPALATMRREQELLKKQLESVWRDNKSIC